MKKIKYSFLGLIAMAQIAFAQEPLTTKSVYKNMEKVANWQLNTLDTGKWKYPATDWTFGAYYTGEMAWAKMANDDRHIEFLKKVGGQNNWKGGPERFFADDYCVGQTYAQLYTIYKDPMMIKEMKRIGDDIIRRSHTESLLWNFEGGLHNREWAWCDALYMGPPMLACLYTATNEKKYLDIANKLWWRSVSYLYNSSERLFFRDSRFFDKREKNGQKVFWSRGNGWVIAGITRMLNNMPKNYKDRNKYEKLFKEMAKRIGGLQQPDGTWHASLLDPANYPVKETSGTAFFVYALAWGINNGLLSYNDYLPMIQKGWVALNDCVHPNGKLGFVQVPGAAPEKVTYDDTEVYGVGAYLLAGTEIFKIIFNRDEAALKASVTNSTAVNRRAEMIEIPWGKLAAAQFSLLKLKVVSAQTGDEIPSQILLVDNKTPKAVIFQCQTNKGSTAYFYIQKQKPALYQPKTFGRIVPERFDDFAWENDKVAFRMYGPALQATGEISSGIDVWGKRTNKLIINDWYKKNDYHKDHGEGMDFYGVGTTLGAGGIAPFINNKLYPSKNFVLYRVLQNGPLRTTFQLNYKSWKAGNIPVVEVKTITLDAGSYLNKVEVNYHFSAPQLPVAVGIAKMPENGKSWSEVNNGYCILSYKQSGDYGMLNLGAIVPAEGKIIEIDSTNTDHYKHTGHYLISTTVKKNTPFIYYQGGAWNKEGTFTAPEEWKQYLIDKETQLKNPLMVTLK